MTVYYDDIHIGSVHESDSYTVSRQEILEFGRRFDPQPFHVDEYAAERSPFGGLVASGWHTAAICMRLLVDTWFGPGRGSLGSPGVDQIRWLKPVRPGDTLTVHCEVLEKRPLQSRPDRGLVRTKSTVRNQRGEDVMTMIGLGFFPLRDQRTAPGEPRP